MESATDMTASSLQSKDPLLVQLHGAHLLHLHLYDPSKCCHMLAFEPLSLSRARVCVHMRHIRWSDRRCLSPCALHGSGMPLVEEDHVHCVNRDNSDLIGLQANSLCILIGWAPDVSLPPCWSQPWQQMGSSQSEPADTTIIKNIIFFDLERTWMVENMFISNLKYRHYGHIKNVFGVCC